MKKLVSAAALAVVLSISCSADDSTPDAKTTNEQFGDWQLICIQTSQKEQCRISQTLSNPQGQTVSVLNVFKDVSGNNVIELALPLMVDLISSPRIQVDENDAVTYPYNLCNGQACFSLVNDEDLINAFKAGQGATISFKPISARESVSIGYSLKGFSRALQALVSKKG